MKRVLLATFTAFASSIAWAEWQLQNRGRYYYFVDGSSIALPSNIPNMYHFKIDRGNGHWEMFFPNAQGDYTVFYSNGRTLWRKLAANAQYEVFNCNLVEFNNYYRQQYQTMIQYANTDFAAYYTTLYQEADILLKTCKAMHGG